MRSIPWSLISVLALGSLAVSCNKNTATSGTDQNLVTAIQSKLYADDSTKAANIKVDVKDGIVTLSGDVPTSDVELEAMKVANATSGVRSVNDQMKVNAAAVAPPSPQTPPAQTPAPPTTATAPPPPMPAPAPVSAPVSQPTADVANTPAPRPRPPAMLTVAAGTTLQVRMIDSIDSKNNSVGQTFRGSLNAPLVRGERVVVPSGAPVTVLLSNATSAGRVKGQNDLQIRVTSITVGGRDYQVASDVYDQAGKAKGKQTAIRSGIGAAAGALIGGLAGGGKGAAIGAGAGGGAGFGYQFFTHGSQVKIPSESVVSFRLATPLSIQR